MIVSLKFQLVMWFLFFIYSIVSCNHTPSVFAADIESSHEKSRILTIVYAVNNSVAKLTGEDGYRIRFGQDISAARGMGAVRETELNPLDFTETNELQFSFLFIVLLFVMISTFLWIFFNMRLRRTERGFLKKIEELKGQQILLAESEKLYRTTLYNISDAVFVTDTDGVFVWVCPNVDKIFGYSVQEILKFKNIYHLLGEKEIFSYAELVQKVELINIEHLVRDKSGQLHNLLINVKSVSIQGGSVLYTCRDITERKESEKLLLMRLQEISGIYTLAGQISKQLSFSKVVEVALKEIVDILKPDIATLYLLQDDVLEKVGEYAIDERYIRMMQKDEHGGKCLCCLTEIDEKIYSPDILLDTRCKLDECKDLGLRSVLTLPLVYGELKIGVLILVSTKENHFKVQDIFLETLVSQIAIGIQNSLFFEKEQQRLSELQDEVQFLSLSANIGAALTSSTDLAEMLQQCCVLFVQHLEAAFARVWTLKPDSDILELQASAGMYTHIDGPHSRIPVGDRYKIGFIAMSRKPILTNAVVGDAQISDQQWAKKEGIVAFAGHPLLIGDRVVGVLGMFARKPFSATVQKALASVADEIALGIDRKFAEEIIIRERDRAQLYFDIAGVISLVLDKKGCIVQVNRKGCQILEYEREELLGCNWFEKCLPLTIRHKVQTKFKQWMNGTTLTGDYSENPVVTSTGNQYLLAWHNTILRDQDGNIIGTLNSGLDISEQRMARDDLQKITSELKTIYDNTILLIAYLDPHFNFLRVNHAYTEASGHSYDYFIGKNYFDLYPNEESEIIFRQVMEAGDPYESLTKTFQYAVHPDRAICFWEWTLGPVKNEKGVTTGLILTMLDVTQRVKAKEALEQSEQRFRSLVETSSDWIWEVNLAGNYTYASPKVNDLLGYFPEEIVGHTPFEFVLAEDREDIEAQFRKFVKNKSSFSGLVNVNLHRNGKQVVLETSGVPVFDDHGHLQGYRGIDRDITSRYQSEERLRQAQKMEAIGTLAGGIAHDFNNILAIIMANLELGLFDISEGTELYGNFQEALMACKRARDLVEQILLFSRQKERDPCPVQFSLIVKEVMKMLRATIPSSIELVLELKTDAALVMADPTELHQILMNLCANATHAMREEGGVLRLKLDKIRNENDQLGSELKGGDYLQLSVRDTGIGILPEYLDRIFEPYFTSKTEGEGTGLGLAIVHGIVSGYDGIITVQSEFGQGTEFLVYLPLLSYGVAIAGEGRKLQQMPGGSERILVVDDESMLLASTKKRLSRLGYTVTVMIDSKEALTVFLKSPDDFDLVITDQTMPKMTGMELVAEIHKIRPDLGIILTTGFSHMVSTEKMRQLNINKLLMKPVLARDMAEAIREVLDVSKILIGKQ